MVEVGPSRPSLLSWPPSTQTEEPPEVWGSGTDLKRRVQAGDLRGVAGVHS